jgi:hypothetical protein
MEEKKRYLKSQRRPRTTRAKEDRSIGTARKEKMGV